MKYNFATRKEFLDFISNLREGPEGEQSTIFFDDKNDRAVKIFAISNYKTICELEEKISELAKYGTRFPKATIPKEIIYCVGRCIGYTMQMLKGFTSLAVYQKKAVRDKTSMKELLEISCNLAELVEDLHSEGITIGDFHPEQFLTKNNEVYVCDTDTWGIANRGYNFKANKVGQEAYIDPLIRDLKKDELVITNYTQGSDYFALAVVVFELIVGFHPFDGQYPLAPKFKKRHKALNQISIIGNHTLKQIDNFTIKDVAWMPKELQSDFLRIFEGKERFNILPSLKLARDNLEECPQGHYYSSNRYSECPVCNPSKKTNLTSFRNFAVKSIQYEDYAIFPYDEVRKMIDNVTYFDYSNNAIQIKEDGTNVSKKITNNTVEFYFVGDNLYVRIERIGRIKQLKDAFFKEPFYDEEGVGILKRVSDKKNLACELKVCNNDRETLYTTRVLLNYAKLKINGHYLFYMNENNELIKVRMDTASCNASIVHNANSQFIYNINKEGDYCICVIKDMNSFDVTVNGRQIKHFNNEIPIVVKSDNYDRGWCIISLDLSTKERKCYVLPDSSYSSIIQMRFKYFSFEGTNLQNVAYYHELLAIPEHKKVIFLYSGRTLVESRVSQINYGVVTKKSKLTIVRGKQEGSAILYVQNNDQVYKFELLVV